ncbi:ArgK/MeaB family GTPase [Roseovarius sp.]|uniref:ArgK/MeaB family GTPase n=1 Tax=Roseovarius sp. TaxID=1486281 RepID=UPI003567A65F
MTEAAARRALARQITRVANANVRDVLTEFEDVFTRDSHRIALTGAPGAGKSTLITGLVRERMKSCASDRMAVLAVDPSSPVSGGSLLGDRIRMDAIAELPGLFIRSLPSRGARNGLCDNVEDLLALVETHGYPEILFETVGVGQSEVDVRALVDTVVLVVPPDAGDSVQTMKAGILEVADIFVVSRGGLSSARRMASDINAILDRVPAAPGCWRAPVVLTDTDGTGLAALSDAISAHAAWLGARENREERARARRDHHLRMMVNRRLDEVLSAEGCDAARDVKTAFDNLIARLPLD